MLTLTAAEITAITHRERPSAQARVLKLLGIPFRYHPTDGGLLVSAAATEAVLTGKETIAKNDQVYSVNVDKLRGRSGKAAKRAEG